MVKWIFFDVGCTLIDETQMWAHRNEETRQMAKEIGKEVTLEQIADKITECAEAYIPIAPTVAAWLGLPDMAPYRGEYEELYPDVTEVLEKLHAKYKLGVIANQPHNLDGRLDKLGILKYFDVVVSSHDVGCVKPDKRIFDLALSRSGAEASECVMVGDRLDNDIEPAKKLGFTTVHIRQGVCATQKPRNEFSTPDYSVADVKGLLEVFDA